MKSVRSKLARTRQQLFDEMERHMNRAYRGLVDEVKIPHGIRLAKTAVIEVAPAFRSIDNIGPRDIGHLLSLRPPRQSEGRIAPAVEVLDEPGFFYCEWRRPNRAVGAYIDAVSIPGGRFWLLHTLSDARDFDWVVDRLTLAHAEIDRIWLPPGFLAAIQRWGEPRGFGTDYDYRQVAKGLGGVDQDEYLKMQVWGGKLAARVHDILKTQDDEITRSMVFSKVRLLYRLESSSGFAIDEVKFNGKFTARGPSFDAHFDLVWRTCDIYSKALDALEEAHVLRLSARPEAPPVEGMPVTFTLSPPVEDLDAFCEVVFSGNLPFRLWGLVQTPAHGQDLRIVRAVDYHSASEMLFEVAPEEIVAYLYDGACGNSLVRFWTNLQHLLGSRVMARTEQRPELAPLFVEHGGSNGHAHSHT